MTIAGGKRKKPFIVGFDTEDDGEGHPFLWCFVSSEGSYYTEHREDALQWLSNLASAKDKYQVEAYATNLEYDMVNLYGQDRIAEVSLKFGRSSLVGASWHRVNFRDTLRHIPISVAEWGEFVGLEKKEKRLFVDRKSSRTLKRYLIRCQRDAAITYRAAEFLHAQYKSLGVRPRMTLASTALNLWREKYWKQGLRRPQPDIWNAALGAYHGGRTQAFHVGEFENVTAIDVASMFPWAMTAAELPVPWGLYRIAREGEDPVPWGLYRVRVQSNIDRPVLPVRTDIGTVYPNGTWDAWYVGEELMNAREHGARIQVLTGYVFAEMCRPFDDYVRDIFRRKNRARGGPRMFYKFMANTLYGKFRATGKACVGNPNRKAFHDAKPALGVASLERSRDLHSRWSPAALGKQRMGSVDNRASSCQARKRNRFARISRSNASVLRYRQRDIFGRKHWEISREGTTGRTVRVTW